MATKLIVKMPDGSKWAADTWRIAKDLADYRANVDGYSIGGKEWEEEKNRVMEDHRELIDWCLDNMDWVDLYAEMIRVPEDPDYASWFTDGATFKIVDEGDLNAAAQLD